WTVGSVVTGVGGVAKGGVKLAKVGVDVGKKSLELMEETAKKVKGKTAEIVNIQEYAQKVADKALVNSGGKLSYSGEPLLDMSKLSNQQKGVMGELFGEGTVKKIVPDGRKVGRSPGIGETGIDDLYQVKRTDVDFVIIEYKFNTAKLKKTNDGKQMSDSWLNGENTGYNRVLESVNGNRQMASDIRIAMDSGRVEKWVVRTFPDGTSHVEVLNKNAKNMGIDNKSSTILSTLDNFSGVTP
ncbi:hypothetical protein, partial [Endozoicomonas sp. ALE010]